MQPQPKGRGRARGRAAARTDAPAPAPAPAPGTAAMAAPAAAAPSQRPPPGLSAPGHEQPLQQQQQPVDPRGAGRAADRGSHSGEPGMAEVTERMAGLRTAEGGARDRGGLARKLLRYVTPAAQPTGVGAMKGTSGQAIQLVSNFIRLDVQPNWNLYQMAVEFRPFLGAKPLRDQLLRDSDQVPHPYVYDGGIMYSSKPLSNPDGVKFPANIRSWSGEVAIRQVGKVEKNSPQWLHLMNVVLSNAQQTLNMQMVGRNYYFPDQATHLPQHKIHVWPGFEMAIGPSDGPLMLHLDVSHKIIHSKTVLDVMYEIYDSCGGDVQRFHNTVTELLVGQIVMTTHNNKTYRIDGISWNENISKQFTIRNRSTKQDELISIEQYFARAYNIRLQDSEQPLLVSKPRKRDLPPMKGGKREVADDIDLPPEICYMTGLTDNMRQDRNLMKDLAIYTRLDPQKRRMKLEQFATSMVQNRECSGVFKEFGINVTNQLVRANARQLPPETINMSKPVRSDPERADWDNALKSNGMYQAVSCKNWLFVYSQRDEQTAGDFCNALSRAGSRIGMQFGDPYTLAIGQDRDQVWVKTIEDNVNEEIEMVFCLLPSNKKQRYDAIKKLCYVSKPVPSQCVLTKTVRNPAKVMSVATKVALQMSCKLGGIAWALNIPLKGTMIVGMDTYHDKRQSVSVQGVVFSLNTSFTQYYSYAPIVKRGKAEMHERLQAGFHMALNKFRQCNEGQLPARIILYRDGVGDSMLEEVKNSELKQLLDYLPQVYGGRAPGFKAVVVKKRVTSRVFRPAGPVLKNPMPGTVIDEDITTPSFYDFFLVSQYVGQGTVTPTHYNVIVDQGDANIKADHVQQLTYKLTHLYFNWPGTIRVPAPCHYAHRLAYLVGQNLMAEPDPKICDRLFFL